MCINVYILPLMFSNLVKYLSPGNVDWNWVRYLSDNVPS